MAFLKWPDKDPDERLDYHVDFTSWVETGRTIDSVNATIEEAIKEDGTAESPVTLLINTQVVAGNKATLWLSGGLLGATYTLKVLVTDDNASPEDREAVRRVKLKIKKR